MTSLASLSHPFDTENWYSKFFDWYQHPNGELQVFWKFETNYLSKNKTMEVIDLPRFLQNIEGSYFLVKESHDATGANTIKDVGYDMVSMFL